MTPGQYHLLTRGSGWMTLWLIVDFDTARAHAVASVAGGTYHLPNGRRGYYDTTSKGMTARVTPPLTVVTTVTWAEVRAWSAALTDTTRARAATLRARGQEIQRSYPPIYPGIGRAYCWDERTRHTGDDCTQCETDRADLTRAHDAREQAVDEWHDEKRRHDTEVRDLLNSLAPDPEPLDLLDLLAEQE